MTAVAIALQSPDQFLFTHVLMLRISEQGQGFSLVLLASHRARAVSAGAQIMVDRDNDKNPVVALREIADDVIDAEALKETLIGTLQRVDERSEAEEEAETLALLADPQHMHMSEQELVRALQSDRDGGQEERY